MLICITPRWHICATIFSREERPRRMVDEDSGSKEKSVLQKLLLDPLLFFSLRVPCSLTTHPTTEPHFCVVSNKIGPTHLKNTNVEDMSMLVFHQHTYHRPKISNTKFNIHSTLPVSDPQQTINRHSHVLIFPPLSSDYSNIISTLSRH